MIESLYIGASGLHTQQTHLSVISNNVANLNTPAFKKDRPNFTELVQRSATNGTSQGMGTAISWTEKMFQAGPLKKTNNELDVAIQGNGFLEVVLPDGGLAYTRAGGLALDHDGTLITADGLRLSSDVRVPADAQGITIHANGEVYARLPDGEEPLLLGQLELANFGNPSALEAIGDNLYGATERSGDAYYGIAGENGFGVLGQGYLEASNVDLVEELTDLVVAQRAYQVSARLVQASDQLLGITNDLRA
jgi:flagellar basal-body rod protein FlgG